MSEKTKLKISKSGYYKPTPEKWRKLGDAFLAVSSTITTFAIVEDYDVIALCAVVIGSVGKFLTNFFSEE